MGVRRVGIDTGGTFTDGVVVEGGVRRTAKTPSTPEDPGRAVRTALAQLGGLEAGGRLHHGSTVGTNAVLTREGARVVLVTTSGFEDVLRLDRGMRADLHALRPSRPSPLTSGVVGVRERMAADGTVVTKLVKDAVDACVRDVEALAPEAVAVCLLHSPRDARHERRLGQALRRALGKTSVHLSSQLAADPREAERGRTTVLDAFVGPKVVSYVMRLARGLPAGALTVMRSDGGRMTVAEVRRAPVRTLLSGPAAGVAAAFDLAHALGIERALSFDVGGTSTDVAWIEGRDLPVREALVVGEHTASVPSLALETVGAGGGSVVWIDAGKALRVGPKSAGADPGPACYGHDGPFTLTDAWLVLGRLPEALLGGSFALDRGAAIRAGHRVAREAGTSLERLARGAVQVAAVATARALRRASVAEGHDPRGAHLIAFGGAGPALAAETADLLELRGVVVPRHAGAVAAWGTLLAPLRADASRVVTRADPAGLERLRAALSDDVDLRLRKQGVDQPRLRTELDARYVGQAFEVTVPYGKHWARAFHERHRARFGFSDDSRDVEVLRLRVRGVQPTRRRSRTSVARSRAHQARPYDTRDGIQHHVRDDLRPGARVRGPAVVEETTATTWVPEGWRASRLGLGELRLERIS